MLFFILPLAVCLLSAPLMTHQMMEASYQRSREQIAVDNAAIAWGEEMALLVEEFGVFEKERSKKEARHHLLHGKEPARDAQSEAELALWIAAKMTPLRARWRGAFAVARAQARELKESIGFEKVSADDFPLESKLCPRCSRSFLMQWKPNRFPIRGRIFSQTALRASVGVVVEHDYYLSE